MSIPATDPLAHAWAEFAARERGEAATRIWGLWSADAPPFYVFVLRPDAAAIARVMPVRGALTAAGISIPVPPDFLHVTVQSLGNQDEAGLTPAIADALAEAVAGALRDVPPCVVRLAQVGPFGSGAFIALGETDAARPLMRMQRVVVDALLAANRVPVRHPERAFLPHLSVCYFDAPHPTASVVGALAPFRAADFGSLAVNAVELVRVTGDGSPYPPMETMRRIPLGG